MRYYIQAENNRGECLLFVVKAVSFFNAIDKADAFIDNHNSDFVRKNIGARLHGEEYGIPEHWPSVTVSKGGPVVA